MSEYQFKPTDMTHYPANWQAAAGEVGWVVDGTQTDLYLMPGDHPTALSSYWDLTGRPASASHVDLGRAPYILIRAKFI